MITMQNRKHVSIFVSILILVSISCSGLGNGTDASSVPSDGTPSTYRSPTLGITSTFTPTFSPSLTWTLTPDPIPHLRATYVAISGNVCAITTVGGLVCWGSNREGQLGDGTNIDSYTPVNVVGLSSGVVSVDGGLGHACAVTDAGVVKCWGDGIKTTQVEEAPTKSNNVPVDVVNLPGEATDVVIDKFDTCVLTRTGGVKCWANNQYNIAPVDIYGLTSGVQAIAAGEEFTCALTKTGAVKCWGDNTSGQLGNGKGEKYNSKTSSEIPVDVIGLSSGVTAIAAGSEHACALTSAGGVKCWGQNYYGELGDGTGGLDTDENEYRNSPVDVIGMSDSVRAIYAGRYNTCAQVRPSGYKCWGESTLILLSEIMGETQNIPIEVPFLREGFRSISIEGGIMCGIQDDYSVMCWGYNPVDWYDGTIIEEFISPVYIPCPDCAQETPTQ